MSLSNTELFARAVCGELKQVLPFLYKTLDTATFEFAFKLIEKPYKGEGDSVALIVLSPEAVPRVMVTQPIWDLPLSTRVCRGQLWGAEILVSRAVPGTDAWLITRQGALMPLSYYV